MGEVVWWGASEPHVEDHLHQCAYSRFLAWLGFVLVYGGSTDEAMVQFESFRWPEGVVREDNGRCCQRRRKDRNSHTDRFLSKYISEPEERVTER